MRNIKNWFNNWVAHVFGEWLDELSGIRASELRNAWPDGSLQWAINKSRQQSGMLGAVAPVRHKALKESSNCAANSGMGEIVIHGLRNESFPWDVTPHCEAINKFVPLTTRHLSSLEWEYKGSDGEWHGAPKPTPVKKLARA